MRKKDKQTIIELLEKRYNGIGTALHYNSPFELLCAVIMSAQCTDERINKITARIFPRLNTPEKMGALTQEQLEEEIRDCGLYRAKAKNLLGMCHMLTEEFGGVIPKDIPTDSQRHSDSDETAGSRAENSGRNRQCDLQSAGHCCGHSCVPHLPPSGTFRRKNTGSHGTGPSKADTQKQVGGFPSLVHLARTSHLQSTQAVV